MPDNLTGAVELAPVDLVLREGPGVGRALDAGPDYARCERQTKQREQNCSLHKSPFRISERQKIEVERLSSFLMIPF